MVMVVMFTLKLLDTHNQSLKGKWSTHLTIDIACIPLGVDFPPSLTVAMACLLTFYRLQMIARQGRFVEYSVFGKETTTDWTIISDAKGE